MANENMRLSEAGWAELRLRESAVMAYYNDQVNNCTYGVGTLAHTGPCTPEELRRPVTPSQVNAQPRSVSAGRRPPCDDMSRLGN